LQVEVALGDDEATWLWVEADERRIKSVRIRVENPS
jgi:hypothetical protein